MTEQKKCETCGLSPVGICPRPHDKAYKGGCTDKWQPLPVQPVQIESTVLTDAEYEKLIDRITDYLVGEMGNIAYSYANITADESRKYLRAITETILQYISQDAHTRACISSALKDIAHPDSKGGEYLFYSIAKEDFERLIAELEAH